MNRSQEIIANKHYLLTELIDKFHSTMIELPKRLKGEFKDQSIYIILKGRELIVKNAPKINHCNICLSKIQSFTYFQCVSCYQYLCTNCYSTQGLTCKNCGGKFLPLPVTCSHCKLDFIDVSNFENSYRVCPLCNNRLKLESLIFSILYYKQTPWNDGQSIT